MSINLITIGLYGFDEQTFFDALCNAKVDTFCDIRRRRGVRGSTYAFANSLRLQTRLTDLGIRYVHRIDLAPTQTVRDKQKQEDLLTKTAKRKRIVLGQEFIKAYRTECLEYFDPIRFLADLEDDTQVLVFFCVEASPAACHRSLVAEKFENELGLKVEHILP